MSEYLLGSPAASLIFILTLISSIYALQRPYESRRWMLNPYSIYHNRRYETLITSGFIHADWQHLLFNMVSFYFFAFELEGFMAEVAGPIGHLFFFLIYILSMVLADVSSIFKHKDDPGYYSLGASGAISGIIFSFILFAPTSTLGFFFIPNIPAPIFAVLYVVFSIYAGRQNRDNINHEAHLWGAVAGLIMTAILFPGVLQNCLAEIKAHWFSRF